MNDAIPPTRSRRSIYIDDHLWETLADLGRRSDRSVANLVRQAVMEFIVASGATGQLPTTSLSAPGITPGISEQLQTLSDIWKDGSRIARAADPLAEMAAIAAESQDEVRRLKRELAKRPTAIADDEEAKRKR